MKNKKRKNPMLSIGIWVAFAVFAIYSISLLFPFVWMLLNSFRNVDEWRHLTSLKDYWSWPSNWDFTNYIKILQENLQGGKFIIDDWIFLDINYSWDIGECIFLCMCGLLCS